MHAGERRAKRLHEQVTARHGRPTAAQTDDGVVQEHPAFAVPRQQEAPQVQEHWSLVKLKELAAAVIWKSQGTLTKAQAWNTVLDGEPGRQLYQAYRQHLIETLRRR